MNSWDCFDTLIARSFLDPKYIFTLVGNHINDSSFIKKRIKAEKLSKNKTYEDIYKYLPEYDQTLELEIEKKYTFPILENWNRVKDGDVIISDMYLSKYQIRSLLDYHGFNKDVDIIVSYSGKHSGASWDLLKSKYSNHIFHTGDNIKSDVIVPRLNNINSIFYAGSSFTPVESTISSTDYHLSCLMRKIRLSNPYVKEYNKYIHNNGSFQHIAGHIWREEINGYIKNYFTMFQYVSNEYMILSSIGRNNLFVKITHDGESFISTTTDFEKKYEPLYLGRWLNYDENYQDIKKLLWDDQSQFNIPILINIALLLPQSGKILFSQRDCFYLYLVYKAITNNLNCDMLDVSRRGYYAPFNEDYINYIFNKTKDALIVDSHGTGSSANHFFKHNDIDFNLYHIFKHPIKKGNVDTNTLTWNKICNRSFNCYGRFFEKYNINHSGVLIDWVENKAVRKKSEHDKDSCDTVKECIDFLLKHIHQYNNCNYNVLNFNFLIKELSGTFTEQFINTIGK